MKTFFTSLLIALSFNALAVDSMKPTQMDDLIRGEMAAVKSYNQILSDIKDQNEKKKLEKIRTDHETAVSKLKSYASKDVLEDTKTAGAWGLFAKTWTGGAKLMGNEAALKALKEGEEHGISEYKEALEDETLKPEVKQMIRTQFLPKQEEHLKTINTFM